MSRRPMPPRTERRADALSKTRIVEAAIAILDAEGEAALTFRALSARLATGAGAIYWHVTDKNDLLAAAADAVVTEVMARPVDAEPRAAIRAIALNVFYAVNAHPWVGAQFFRDPARPAALQVLEGVGQRLQALKVPETAQFDTATALVSYILGVAGQNAANACQARESGRTDRGAFLGGIADQWAALDPEQHPFVRRMAASLRDHDDRAQFLAGVDLILAGAATLIG